MPYRFFMRYPRLRADIFGLGLRADIFSVGLAPSNAEAAGPFPWFLHAYASWLMHGMHDTMHEVPGVLLKPCELYHGLLHGHATLHEQLSRWHGEPVHGDS